MSEDRCRQRDVRRARALSWTSLVWMTVEGVVGLIAGSFLLLVPFFASEAVQRLITGSHTTGSVLGIAVTASAIVLMPVLGRAKLRLGQRLGSGATAGEGVQNLMCALQATLATRLAPAPRESEPI